MALAPTLRLAVNRDQDLRALPLSPQDFYVFSRVEALSGGDGPSIEDIASASGLDSDTANAIVERLIELGALVVREAQPAPKARKHGRPAPVAGNPELRERARDRRRRLLEAQMRMIREAGGSGAPEGPPPERKPKAKSTSTPQRASKTADGSVVGPAAGMGAESQNLPTAAAASEHEGRPILEAVRPVALNDTRLDSALAVPLESQRRMLAVHDRLGQIGHFELLGLAPTDDPRVIRRAFHITSREFHPDAFYGKELGSFRKILDDLFRRSRASYEFLMDAGQRRTLVDAYLARLQREHEETQAVARAEQARKEAEEAEALRLAAEAERAAKREARRELDERMAVVRTEQRARLARREQKRAEATREQREAQAENSRKGAVLAGRAEVELAQGRHGAAATLYRLALQEDPGNTEYERLWQECLAMARSDRAQEQLERARELRRDGRTREAAEAYGQAAEAHPSLGNLAEAIPRLLDVHEDQRAHELALKAVEILDGPNEDVSLSQSERGQLRADCARAFLAVGDGARARTQAERAVDIMPTAETRALLSKAKQT